MTFNISIGLNVQRNAGSKDAWLNFIRTNAWSIQAGDVLYYSDRMTLYYWQKRRSSFVTSNCGKINKSHNKMKTVPPKTAKPQITDILTIPLMGTELIYHVGNRCEKYDLLPTRESTVQDFFICFHFFLGYGRASLPTQWEIESSMFFLS